MADWKNIPGYDNYEVSDEGNVRNRKSGRILKDGYTRGGYRKVNLRANGDAKSVKVHRLVADNFVPNPTGKSCINHIDGDKTNNRKDNLEWCTHSENNKHAYKNHLTYRPENSGVPKRKVRIVETGVTFESVSDCARFLGAAESGVSVCLSKPTRTCRGVHVTYSDGEVEINGEQA